MMNRETRCPVARSDAWGEEDAVRRSARDELDHPGRSGRLEVLVHRHGAMVLGVCRRMLGNSSDADDAFQATFLLLVRKAGSLAHPEQVAGWLHAVALRVARKARAQRTRRHSREVAVVDLAAPIPADDGRELRAVLDEELDRLPDKYRLPIVLCELEGRTLEEAAQLLGWPKGTVAGRLSRGRDLLRQRLSRRRGLLLPLFFLGGATPPDRLISQTLDTATSTSATATRPAALADSALRDRRWRFGIVLLLALTGGTLAAAAWSAHAAPGMGLIPNPFAPMPVAPPGSGQTSGCHSGSS